ncbi:MAG: GNAT family N-acetyltransferase [Haliscomenobacter sp.]|nr:GNAT family N-acetyltransferase [Haliscomenobacter sp.]
MGRWIWRVRGTNSTTGWSSTAGRWGIGWWKPAIRKRSSGGWLCAIWKRARRWRLGSGMRRSIGERIRTEAGARVLWYGFWELELPEIVAVAMPANGASIRVLEKLGMRLERYGMFYDCYCARLSAERHSFIRKTPPFSTLSLLSLL